MESPQSTQTPRLLQSVISCTASTYSWREEATQKTSASHSSSVYKYGTTNFSDTWVIPQMTSVNTEGPVLNS